PKDHLPKIQRSSAHSSIVYGNRRAGFPKGMQPESDEFLDSSPFVRVVSPIVNLVG
ncbi:hypothetical protein EDD16DRAFT_1449155, partial [Pisolithus croceorrhizus]